MERLQDFLRMLQPGDNLIKIDIQDGYYHLPLALASQQYMGFIVMGVAFVLTAAPMGFTLSPWWFTWAMQCPLTYIRRGGVARDVAGGSPDPIPAIAWLDDFLMVVRDAQQAQEVKELFGRLGLTTHPTKCCWVPTSRMDYLGLVIDVQKGRVEAPADKVARIAGMATALLREARRGKHRVRTRAMMTFAGTANAIALALPAARFFLRPVHDAIRGAPHLYGQVRLSLPGKTALRWWQGLQRTVTVPPHNGRPLWQHPTTLTIHTDAATDYLTQAAWGGVINWGQPDQETVRGVFTARELATEHINTLELRAITLTIRHCRRRCANAHLMLFSDSEVVVRVLQNLTSRSGALYTELGALLHLTWSMRATFLIEHIPGVLNILADRLSRPPRPSAHHPRIPHLPLVTAGDIDSPWDAAGFYYLPVYMHNAGVAKLRDDGGKGLLLLEPTARARLYWSILAPAVTAAQTVRWTFPQGVRTALLVSFVFPPPRE